MKLSVLVCYVMLISLDVYGNLVPLTAYRGKSLWTYSLPGYTWQEADQYCRNKDKVLAVLNNEDQTALKLKPPGSTSVFWVGSFATGLPKDYQGNCPIYDFRSGAITGAPCEKTVAVLCVCPTCNT